MSVKDDSWTESKFIAGTEDVEGSLYGASRVRIAVQGSHRNGFASGSSLRPTLTLATRWEDGVGDAGFGLELAGETVYGAMSGLTVSASGQALQADSIGYRNWGLLGRVGYDGGQDGLGLLVDFSPAWGRTLEGGGSANWNGSFTDSGPGAGRPNEARLDAELGYRISAVDGSGTVTPFTGADVDPGRSALSLGRRWAYGSDVGFGLEGSHVVQSTDDPDHRILINGNIRW